MPLNPIVTTPIMYSALNGAGIFGALSISLAEALSSAICTYGTTSMNVSTIDIGVLGVGKGFGAGVFLPIPVLEMSLQSFLPAYGILGVSTPQLITGIAMGYNQILATAVINTIHTTVGMGAGKLTIFPNTLIAIQTYITAFAAAGLVGSMAISLATAIASGLDPALSSASGVVAIVGSPSIFPSAGVGFGKLL